MWLTKSSCIAMRVSTALTLRQAIWEKVRPRIVAKLKKVEDVRAPPHPHPRAWRSSMTCSLLASARRVRVYCLRMERLRMDGQANAWFSSEPGVAVHKTGTIRLRRVTVATRFESHKTTRHCAYCVR